MVQLEQGNRENNALNFVLPKKVLDEKTTGTGVLRIRHIRWTGQSKTYERNKYSKGGMNVEREIA